MAQFWPPTVEASQIPLVFTAPWTAVGGGSNAVGRVGRLVSGTFDMSGGGAAVAFTLPVGMRPLFTVNVPITSATAGVGVLSINPSGQATPFVSSNARCMGSFSFIAA